MLLHCSEIREAYTAILADWGLPADVAWKNRRALVEHTAALASLQANRAVTDNHVRMVLNTRATSIQ
jgi:hypothetical protein